jgi:hypothetical protein
MRGIMIPGPVVSPRHRDFESESAGPGPGPGRRGRARAPAGHAPTMSHPEAPTTSVSVTWALVLSLRFNRDKFPMPRLIMAGSRGAESEIEESAEDY